MTAPDDFERHVDRYNTHSLKWSLYTDKNITPMWVADMDFAPAAEIKNAIHRYADAESFGYAVHPEEMTETLIARMKRLYDWDTRPEEYIFINGTVPGLNAICRAMSKPGDTVVNFTPIYYPFLLSPANSGLRLRNIPLLQGKNGYCADIETFRSVNAADASVLQFCNPHNPVGKMYDRNELIEIGKVCEEKDLIIASDEIHCDLLLDTEKKHIPFASVSKNLSERVITLMAPTKTWSIPDLHFSFMIIQNPKIRTQVLKFMNGLFGRLSGLSNCVALAAYRDGERWLNNLLPVLRENRDIVFDALSGIPGINVTAPLEATYLAWVDYRQSGIRNVKTYLERRANVGVSDGAPFGGEGFIRINFGCRQSDLTSAMTRVGKALKEAAGGKARHFNRPTHGTD